MAKQSPPMPVEHGSVTFSAAAMATQASTQLPPERNTRKPTSDANGCDDATAPCSDSTGERRDTVRE